MFQIIYLNLEISASDTGVQTDDLDAPLTLYDRNYTCIDLPDGSKNCTEHDLPGIEITEGYPVPIGAYKFGHNYPFWIIQVLSSIKFFRSGGSTSIWFGNGA